MNSDKQLTKEQQEEIDFDIILQLAEEDFGYLLTPKR